MDLLALREAYERELTFMSELVLERARITKELVNLMLQEDQKNALVGLITRRPRPKWWVTLSDKSGGIEREIHFNDIIETALER